MIQKAAQMRQSSGSLLHASSLNRQQHKSPTTIGNHEFPLNLLRVIQVVITNKCLGLKTFIVHGCLGSKGTCLLLLAGISTNPQVAFCGGGKTRYPRTLSFCLVLPPTYIYLSKKHRIYTIGQFISNSTLFIPSLELGFPYWNVQNLPDWWLTLGNKTNQNYIPSIGMNKN